MAVLGLFLLSACQSSGRQDVDALNDLSYAYHYRNIDSAECYARRALGELPHCDGVRDGQAEKASQQANRASGEQRAEAYNNLAFVAIVRMNYSLAERQLDSVYMLTSNQLELFVAEVQQMRLCQRRSRNKEFYDHRERALSCKLRINEERDRLDARSLHRLRYAETEYAIVNSTYYYYVGLEQQSIEALNEEDFSLVSPVRSKNRIAEPDTAQYLNYLYNVGAGGILTEGSEEQIFRDEMQTLGRCLNVAQHGGFVYFEAQAREAMAEHTYNLQWAEEALRLFKAYGDVYQIAGAHRTLASCYHAKGEDNMSLYHLQQALSDSLIFQAPDLVASIREQLSVTYAALDDKEKSAFNRRLYLDVQEETRQDRELEARAGLLDEAVGQLNWMILAVCVAILLLLLLLWLFNHLNRRSKDSHELDDVLEMKQEELAAARQRVEKSERRYLEQRAKVSLAVSILPLIDRIRHAIDRGENHYVIELTDSINSQNDLLTQWIQLRQGELTLRIESFPLQQLFDIIGRGKATFRMKGIELDIRPTDSVVKADRVLTLFMLNTLADNARKYTAKGGRVEVNAEENDRYVEISVSDTGGGVSEEHGHGFGLKNCRGIIEKYRKMSSIFGVCTLQGGPKEEGSGSRYFFRLPKGIVRLVVVLVMMAHGVMAWGEPQPSGAQQQPTATQKQSVQQTLQHYNDSAVAALERHDWTQYRYYNKVYTQLFKEMSADATLADYCRTMQQSRQNKRIAVIVLLVLLATIVPAYYVLYYRHRLYRRFNREQEREDAIEMTDDELRRAELENNNLHVVNSVLDNCLSTLKHETMYYPSRIRQLIDTGQHEQLAEVASYYRDLYAILIQQAMQQAERIPLHVRRIELYGQMVLGNETLLRYLFELLEVRGEKQEGRDLITSEVKDDNYVVYHIPLTSHLSSFTSYLCRQIVRDHGEATNRLACGISVEDRQVTIILPRYNGKV